MLASALIAASKAAIASSFLFAFRRKMPWLNWALASAGFAPAYLAMTSMAFSGWPLSW
jgi:hypothetical protein